MIFGCTRLNRAPSIKAKMLAYKSLSHMFYGCKKLMLSQHKMTVFGGIEKSGYDTMFKECEKLENKITVIDASKL